MEQVRSWFSKLFSGDEFKVSGLMFAFFVTLIFSLVRVGLKDIDIPPNMLTLLLAQVTAIAGINLFGNNNNNNNGNNI
jgi:hypothetical protein